MKNPLKRPLPSMGMSNKYSGSKKRALNARPPQPASVARLESLLDGASKKKRKQSLSSRSSTQRRISTNANTSKLRKPMRAGKDSVDRGDFKRNVISNICRGDVDENRINKPHKVDGKDRWSHVNSKSKSNNRKRAVNPFLETKPKRNTIQADSVDTATGESGKPTVRTKSSTNSFLSEEQISHEQDLRKEKKSHRGKSRGGNPILAKIISRKAIQLPTSAFERDHSEKAINVDSCCKSDAQCTQSSSEISPPQTNLNCVGNKSAASNDETVLSQKDAKQGAAFPGISEGNRPESKSLDHSSNSSLRPKLGLRLFNKTSKGKPVLTSTLGSRFFSSLPVPSSSREPTHMLEASAPKTGQEEEDHLLVLGSPSKATSLELQMGPSSHHRTIQSTVSNSISGHGKPGGESMTIEKVKSTKKEVGLDSSARTRNIAKHKKRGMTTKKKNVNDNFVRLNMKNKAGACRGAKNKSSKYGKERRSWTFRGPGNNATGGHIAGGAAENFALEDSFADHSLPFDAPMSQLSFPRSKSNNESINDLRSAARVKKNDSLDTNHDSKSNINSYVSKMSGLDPLDEFIDGNFHPSEEKTGSAKASVLTRSSTESIKTVFGGAMAIKAPKCARHQRPCKLVKVKKATTGNKGREFYACSMPRGEQCDHFQWADDTIEAARCTIATNTSYSSFITRQVAAYVDRFRTLTVPELKQEVSRRGLNKNGKKNQLLVRIAIWTRDELVKSSPALANESFDDDIESKHNVDLCPSDEILDDDTDCDFSSSEDELELYDGELDDDSENDIDGESTSCDTSRISNECISFQRAKNTDDGSSLTVSLQEIFGHTVFRDGQEWAIRRCLEKKSTLLVAPTGFGKSLCYALPAALMDGVCIVVSPLISLIEDQLRSLPPRVPAATLSGSISTSKTAAILDDIVRKRLKILFVSPERLTSPAFRRLFHLKWNPETRTKERRFPDISLLCIDEAHCISQWAHNFRPCFLRFKGYLKIMNPNSVLAITATAGPKVIHDIGQTLGMDFPESITKLSSDTEHESIKIIRTGRDNIDVLGKFMMNQEERLTVVADILTPNNASANDKTRPLAGKLARGSVIVYVWRQRDTEVVAESLTAAGVAGGVVIYHGGMDANARAKSQNKFMRGKARICVATVAFGMGIDKADIVGIIHLYLSNSPEHYLQEIGRAGRDGRCALAISLPLLEEVPTRHSLAYSNLVSKSQIRSLLRIIKGLVQSTKSVCDTNPNSGRPLHVALPVQSTVRACDCKPETIETFLSLIERIGGDKPLLQIEGYNYDSATIALKKRTLKKLAEKEPLAASIQAVSRCVDAPLSEMGVETAAIETRALPRSFQRHFIAYSKGSHSFSISQCSNRLGPTAEPRHVFAALRRLQSSNELEFVLDTSEVGRIFQLKISEVGQEMFNGVDYAGMEENLVSTIFESFSASSASGATKFLDMHYILYQVARTSRFSRKAETSDPVSPSKKSPSLLRFQELTTKYFGQGLESERSALEGLLPTSFHTIREKELKIDGLSLLRDLPLLFQEKSKNSDPTPEYLKFGDLAVIDYTALAITKFLHGIDTPRTPFSMFRAYPLFGKWKTVNFRLVHDAILTVLGSRS